MVSLSRSTPAVEMVNWSTRSAPSTALTSSGTKALRRIPAGGAWPAATAAFHASRGQRGRGSRVHSPESGLRTVFDAGRGTLDSGLRSLSIPPYPPSTGVESTQTANLSSVGLEPVVTLILSKLLVRYSSLWSPLPH